MDVVDDETRLKLETEAEMLAVCQLDLLAQVEAQVRAVHHLMRRLGQLRARRPGQRHVEMTNGERSEVMVGLSDELTAIEAQMGVQQECCDDMQETIARMRERLPVLKAVAAQLTDTDAE
jgi:hypothetical protein